MHTRHQAPGGLERHVMFRGDLCRVFFDISPANGISFLAQRPCTLVTQMVETGLLTCVERRQCNPTVQRHAFVRHGAAHLLVLCQRVFKDGRSLEHQPFRSRHRAIDQTALEQLPSLADPVPSTAGQPQPFVQVFEESRSIGAFISTITSPRIGSSLKYFSRTFSA